MKNKLSVVSIILVVFVLIPQIVFASWWNPFSWNWKALFNSPVKNETQMVNPVTNPVVNTEPINNSKTINPAIKDTTKNIPVVDNSAMLKSEVQAKIDAGLKAKAEQDALIAKQKADEQAKLEADQKLKEEQDALITKQNEEVLAKAEKEQHAREEKLDSLKSQFFQVIDDINRDCSSAFAGSMVTKCTFTEIKLQPILDQEVALGVTVQEVASELTALQDAYNRLQTEYYGVLYQPGVTKETAQGRAANVASEIQILANYKAMFTN